jgi:hypothetical protein
MKFREKSNLAQGMVLIKWESEKYRQYGVIMSTEYFQQIKKRTTFRRGACGSVVGWGTMLQAGRSRVQVPMRSLDFLHLT